MGHSDTLRLEGRVTYLMAITLAAQNLVKAQKKQHMQAPMAQIALQFGPIPNPEVMQTADAVVIHSPDETHYNPGKAQILYGATYAQCHPISDFDDVPATTEEEASEPLPGRGYSDYRCILE